MNVAGVKKELAGLGTPERAAGAKAYLKSDLEFLGCRVPDLRALAKRWLGEHPQLGRAELLSTVEALWREPVHELRNLAGILLQMRATLLTPADLPFLQRLIRESLTWAYVDLLSTRAVGSIAERFPETGAVLDEWSSHEDFWVRRAAMLALLMPLRRGEGDWERFTRYADEMWEEKEFFIRKAIGWVLREVAKVDAGRVIRFVEPRAARASGVTMREAVKYLPPPDRDRLLALYREGRV